MKIFFTKLFHGKSAVYLVNTDKENRTDNMSDKVSTTIKQKQNKNKKQTD